MKINPFLIIAALMPLVLPVAAEPAAETAALAQAPETAGASVFDEILKGNLVVLKDGAFVKHEPTASPKHYVFYYTASWCGPCQRFTPSLVEFYNKHKKDNDAFEIILISSDRNEEAMLGYAKDKKMTWPHLKLSEVKAFRQKFDHGVRGIPSVIVCDAKGEILSRNGRDLAELAKFVE